ncbi:MAG: hypothetical protein WC981_04315 [Candidatus Dojkabacteria bacterium]
MTIVKQVKDPKRVAKIFGIKVHEFAKLIGMPANSISSIRRKEGLKGLFANDIASLVYQLEDHIDINHYVKHNYFYEYEKHMKKKYRPKTNGINKEVKQAQNTGDLAIFDKLQEYIKECKNELNEIDPSDGTFVNMVKIQIIADMNRIDYCINELKGRLS